MSEQARQRNKTSDFHLNLDTTAHDKLDQIRSRRGPKATKSDLIREAIYKFISEQEDQIGSKAHFSKSLQQRIDRLESNIEQSIPAKIKDDITAVQESLAAVREAQQVTQQMAELVTFLAETLLCMNAMTYSLLLPQLTGTQEWKDKNRIIQNAMFDAQQRLEITQAEVNAVKTRIQPQAIKKTR